MSSVRFLFPENKLAKLLKTPGGKAASEAVRDAQANLDVIRGEGIGVLNGVLSAAEATHKACPKTFDEASLDELYRIACEPIGVAGACGLPAVDTVLTSLCDLLEHFKVNQLWDLVAIQVHLRAFRLLLNEISETEGAGVEAILDGLKKVSARYA